MYPKTLANTHLQTPDTYLLQSFQKQRLWKIIQLKSRRSGFPESLPHFIYQRFGKENNSETFLSCLGEGYGLSLACLGVLPISALLSWIFLRRTMISENREGLDVPQMFAFHSTSGKVLRYRHINPWPRGAKVPASSVMSGKSGSYALSFGEIIGYCWLFGTFAKCDFLAGVYIDIIGKSC